MNWKTPLTSLLLLAGTVAADDFKAANALYDVGRFSEAAVAYEQLQPKTAHLYYNLGNTYFRLGLLGKAVLNFERARQLMPDDPDILANLRFAEEQLGVAEVNQPAKSLTRYWRSLVESRTVRQWAIFEVVALWALAGLIGFAVWWPRFRSGLVILASGAGIALLTAGMALGYRAVSERIAPVAVVLAGKTEARFAPQASATVRFQLSEGTKVSIREDRGQWLLLERADSQQGWVRAEMIERVARPLLKQ